MTPEFWKALSPWQAEKLVCSYTSAWHPELVKGYISNEKQQIKAMAVLSFSLHCAVMPLFFPISFCATRLSSDLFFFQKLSSQFFFVHGTPLFALPFTHTCLAQHLQYFLYCMLTGACNMQFNNRMLPFSHGLTLTISFHTFHDLNFESLYAFLSFLALGMLFSSYSSLGVSNFGAFMSRLVTLFAHACTIQLSGDACTI